MPQGVSTLSHALTLRQDKILFILEPSEFSTGLARKRVTIYDYPDCRLEIQYDRVTLPYRTFDKLQSVIRAEVVEDKRLGPALEMIAAIQAEREVSRSRA